MWEKIKKWSAETAGPWILRSWLQIVNILIVFVAYGKLDNLEAKGTALLGIWGFVLVGYWLFWKFFGADKVVMPLLRKLWKRIFGKK
jgi:hypothetical protein